MRWQLLSQHNAYRGFFSVDCCLYRIERFNGAPIEVKRELFSRGMAAAVLIYDPQADAVVMVEQFRAGATALENPWLLELVAGMVETGEDSMDVVAREAQEEAGCVIGTPFLIADYLASPGGSQERLQIFAATADSRQIANFAGLQEEGEDIKTHVIARQQLAHMLAHQQINNAMTLIGVQWLMLNFEKWQQAGFAPL